MKRNLHAPITEVTEVLDRQMNTFIIWVINLCHKHIVETIENPDHANGGGTVLDQFRSSKTWRVYNFWKNLADTSARMALGKPINEHCDDAHWFKDHVMIAVTDRFGCSGSKEAAQLYARLAEELFKNLTYLLPSHLISTEVVTLAARPKSHSFQIFDRLIRGGVDRRGGSTYKVPPPTPCKEVAGSKS